jgi:hypothetical protein
MGPRRFNQVNCPHCGAVNPSFESTCSACSRGLLVYIGPARALPRRVGIGAIMALVAVVAVGLAMIRPAPVLGVAWLVLVPTAVVRSVAAASQRAEDGRPMGLDERTWAFASSFGVMLAAAIAGGLTFMVVCAFVTPIAVPFGAAGRPGVFAVGVSIAGGIGAFVAYRVLARLWPYRE